MRPPRFVDARSADRRQALSRARNSRFPGTLPRHISGDNIVRMALTRLAWLSAALIALGSSARGQPPTMAAAQVELLALRTSVPKVITVRRDSVWLEAAERVVSLDSAARALTRLSKPSVCGGKPGERGLLRVSCRRLQDLSPFDIGGLLLIRYGMQDGHVMSDLLDDVRRYHGLGIDTLRAMCTGRDTLFVPAVALDVWHRDYYQPIFDTAAFPLGMGTSGDLEHDGRTALARQYGIIMTMSFSPSLKDTTEWKKDYTGNPGVLSPAAEDFQVSQLLAMVTILNLGGDEAQLRPALAKIADMFARYWTGRGTMPPQEAMDFIGRYRDEHPPSRAPLPKET